MIAEELNHQGILTKRGNRWESNTIYYMVRNEKYIGEVAQNKEITERIENLLSFLDHQTIAIIEYSDDLVRRLIEQVNILPNKLEIVFKSGISREVEL